MRNSKNSASFFRPPTSDGREGIFGGISSFLEMNVVQYQCIKTHISFP